MHDHGEKRTAFVRVLEGSLGVQRYVEDEWGQVGPCLGAGGSFMIPEGDCVELCDGAYCSRWLCDERTCLVS